MKRYNFLREEIEITDNINMANVLMLLSRDHCRVVNGENEEQGPTMSHHRRSHEGRVFECKTCSRQFHSFQALGGHRASHKKPRVSSDGPTTGQKKPTKAHECSVCGLEFGVGQALGGHMRRHRGELLSAGGKYNEKKRVSLLLDLNLLPPSDDEVECRVGVADE